MARLVAFRSFPWRRDRSFPCNETGKVKLNLAIAYTPTGGDPSTQSMKVKLQKKL